MLHAVGCAAFSLEGCGKRMQEKVKVTFLVNAAILLEFRGIKLLIDGIYDENGHCFSNLSTEQWESLKTGQGEFSNIDYLLFTHEHGDHFSAKRVAEYLEYQQPKAIFMSAHGSAALERLKKQVEQKGIPCVLLDAALCRKAVFRPEKDIRIKALQTRHLDRIYWDMPHFCYLIECGEKKLLFTGDVDFTQERFPDLKGVLLDAVFVNPLMSHSKEGKRLLSDGTLQAKMKIVYHIPFAGEDKMMIRRVAEQEMQRREGTQGDTVFFMEAGQTCFI